MNALLLRTSGLDSDWATAMVEMAVSMVTGVARVIAVKSLGIVSVLFDETKASAEEILRAVRAVGFEAQPISASGS